MNLSAPFIRRPIATTLLTIAVALAGFAAYFQMPVSPLPQIDFPTISVSAGLPGGSPEVMASSVATPLERQFGRIAGVTEMTSTSNLGSTSITLQFDLNRDINAAARDVQAAINAARGYLPANLPSNPTYRKVNPSDSPIMIIALTSDLYDRGRLYDFASTLMQQRLSQIQGVGQVIAGGSSLPAVRVELDPTQLNSYGLGLEDVRTAIAAQNANRPKGQIADKTSTADLTTNDQLFKASQYQPLIVSYHGGAAVRLSDIGKVTDSVEDIRNSGMTNGKPSVLVIVFRQPGANIIDTVARLRQSLPPLMATLPAGIAYNIVLDQTLTIRASVQEVERTLVISTLLVILVVFFFLRDVRATFIPSVAVPVSLIGTFGVMYLLGFSIDNLSLMALTIATGFVVDDAIVVVENITRYREKGMNPMEAAFKGASEIGFTVLSISISLVAVFIPLLMMGGIIGRLFREFAVTLSTAILVSLLISLTTTPMLCSLLLKKKEIKNETGETDSNANGSSGNGNAKGNHVSGDNGSNGNSRNGDAGGRGAGSDTGNSDADGGLGANGPRNNSPLQGRGARGVGKWFYDLSENFFNAISKSYERALGWVLKHSAFMLGVFFFIFAANIWLFIVVPKGFFPQQDTGRLMGAIQGTQDTSFQAMQGRMAQFVDIVRADPAIENVVAFIGGGGGGGGSINVGRMFVTLKPLQQRKISADQVINRLRPKLAKVTGATAYLQAA